MCVKLCDGVAAPEEVPDRTTTEPRAEAELTMPLVVGRTVMVVLPPLAAVLALEVTSMTVVGAVVTLLVPVAVTMVASGAGRTGEAVVAVVVAGLSHSRLLMATAELRSVNCKPRR